MTYTVLFVLAYMLGLLFAFTMGYSLAMLHNARAREKLVEAGQSAFQKLLERKAS